MHNPLDHEHPGLGHDDLEATATPSPTSTSTSTTNRNVLSFEDFSFHAFDELDDDQRWSTWSSVERLMRGPQPRPAWVVTEDGAIDTELGVLKTGKEADVFLVERAVPGDPARASLLAAKRYRGADHRQFQRSVSYTEGRQIRKSRDARAAAKATSFGRAVAASHWA
ncbi:MAG: hypothetical protein ACRDQA_31255, partial [Nocardioidaceae bacterium]